MPPDVKAAVAQVSSFLIITAIAALGMKTSLLALARIGIAPVMLLITETIFIGLLVIGLIYGLRRSVSVAWLGVGRPHQLGRFPHVRSRLAPRGFQVTG